MKELLAEFFELMEREEESDSGKTFRPNQISSCRAMDGLRIDQILKELKCLLN